MLRGRNLVARTITRNVTQSRETIKRGLNFPGSVKSSFVDKFRIAMPADSPPLSTYRLVNLDGTLADPNYEVPFSEQQSLQLYRDMVTISILDQIMYDAQRQGRLSFYMVSAGEEGIAVGSAAALGKDDQIFCQYREQGVLLHRGMTLTEMMAQLYGNADDLAKGKMMPVHYANLRINLHPISSPLTSQLPHAAGAAYALKLDGKSAISICYFGEGAASEGDFHAGLNIAATRGCPVVYVCRNNGYAISTPSLEQYHGDGIASRGIGYGIPTIRVDGNDILAVHQVTKAARDLAINEKTPVLIEAMSYRVSHHSTSDDSFAYRAKAEVDDWRRRDNPITRLRKYLEQNQWWNDELETSLRKQIRKEVLHEFNAAEKVKKPAISNTFEDVWAEMPAVLKEQQDELRDLLARNQSEYDLDAFEGGLEKLKEN